MAGKVVFGCDDLKSFEICLFDVLVARMTTEKIQSSTKR